VVKPSQVRFYFDADLLGLAKVLAGLRSDITYPGDPGGVVHKRERPPCTVTDRAALDTEWIPECARQGWVIITRDSRIQDRPPERDAVRLYDARMVALVGIEARTTWMQLEVVLSQWRAIERCTDEPGPFIYSATRTTFRPIVL